MTWLIPNRQHVAQLKYQLRKFEKQCADLPAETRARISSEMQGLSRLLAAVDEEADAPEAAGNRCEDNGLDHRWSPSWYSHRVFCTKCGKERLEGEA